MLNYFSQPFIQYQYQTSEYSIKQFLREWFDTTHKLYPELNVVVFFFDSPRLLSCLFVEKNQISRVISVLIKCVQLRSTNIFSTIRET